MPDATSLPTRKPVCGQSYSGRMPRFGRAGDAVSAFFAQTTGKVLLISDGFLLPSVASASVAPRAVTLVFDGDALPLFSMPDGVRGVIAAGGEQVLRAARYFAEVQGASLLMLPSHAALDGAYERTGTVTLAGDRMEVPLKEGEISCDLLDMVPSFTAAYGRLLLARLALFEEKALARFERGCCSPLYEEAFAALEFTELTAEELVCTNALLRMWEADGLPAGEGMAAAALAGDGIAAYRTLSALYLAFFRRGKPRRYFVADYRERARRAGRSYDQIEVPSPEECARRALLLERMRAEEVREMEGIVKREGTRFRNLRDLGGSVPAPVPAARLATLPERCPQGLTAIMRDFGLMEFHEDV